MHLPSRTQSWEARLPAPIVGGAARPSKPPGKAEWPLKEQMNQMRPDLRQAAAPEPPLPEPRHSGPSCGHCLPLGGSTALVLLTWTAHLRVPRPQDPASPLGLWLGQAEAPRLLVLIYSLFLSATRRPGPPHACQDSWASVASPHGGGGGSSSGRSRAGGRPARPLHPSQAKQT